MIYSEWCNGIQIIIQITTYDRAQSFLYSVIQQKLMIQSDYTASVFFIASNAPATV